MEAARQRQSRRGGFGKRIGGAVTFAASKETSRSAFHRRSAPPGAVPGPPARTRLHDHDPASAPHAPARLDLLWVQVAGSLCNLSCSHCYGSCGPAESRHRMMSREQVRERVGEALELGARAVVFTGGEPFLHRDLEAMVADTLPAAPVTVLTNGTLLTPRRIAALVAASREAAHALAFHVSLDGPDPASHAAVRGPGTFERALAGLQALADAGFAPAVAATLPPGEDREATAAAYAAMLRAAGFGDVEVHLSPRFGAGRCDALAADGGAVREERPGASPPPCATSRTVSSGGVFICPLLADEPAAFLGDSLAAALLATPPAHPVCGPCMRASGAGARP